MWAKISAGPQQQEMYFQAKLVSVGPWHLFQVDRRAFLTGKSYRSASMGLQGSCDE